MRAGEGGRMRRRFGIQEIVDIALTIERDVLAVMPGDRLEAHLAKQSVKNLRLRMGELDEFEAVGAGGVRLADRRLGRVVRKRTHR